jgi:hypothetical protein
MVEDFPALGPAVMTLTFRVIHVQLVPAQTKTYRFSIQYKTF